MKRLKILVVAAFVLAAFASLSFAASWVSLGKTKKRSEHFYDNDSIVKKENNITRVWVKFKYPSDDPDNVDNQTVYEEIDCTQKKFRFLQINTYYVGKDDPSVISDPTDWDNIVPDTMTMKVLDAVCR